LSVLVRTWLIVHVSRSSSGLGGSPRPTFLLPVALFLSRALCLYPLAGTLPPLLRKRLTNPPLSPRKSTL
jgi:hypothetical protein